MDSSTIHVQVPGKLFVAGEYAVLERDQLAIVLAVNRYMTGTIQEASKHTISLPQLGYDEIHFEVKKGEVFFSQNEKKFPFVRNALSIFYQFLYEVGISPRPFRLTVTSELDDKTGKKFGLGSSAAIVVTVITALLNFYQCKMIRPSKELIYKLSAIIHYQTQGNGSCADIAASTYGGWLSYQMFQPDWLIGELEGGTSLNELVKMDWPSLYIKRISAPSRLSFAVGWTKTAASTAPMVSHVQKLKEEAPSLYEEFLLGSRRAVLQILDSFKRDDIDGAIEGFAENRRVLKKLSAYAKVDIETPALKKFIEIANKYGSGKSSGAGGGDCGIAFVKDRQHIDFMLKEWRDANIEPLGLQLSNYGAIPSEE
ncbi:phosphomevalonate kinase [Bacillus andreraoultii]|uniref:phosphomevalonate kinase n=1 Tax=Bacillus andreraoultii TaxID=1499685 RepID=UPI000539CE0E|nr:phosphomevalonate kinase [Bacillus andreraoultii]